MSNPYIKALKIYLDKCGEDEPDYETSFAKGWEACKEEALKILNTPIHNLDLSTDFCDEVYINRIKKL